MRQLQIDPKDFNIKTGGYKGEHNATEIDITLDKEVETASYYRLSFEGPSFSWQSDKLYPERGRIKFILPQSLCSECGELKYQLTAYSISNDGNTIAEITKYPTGRLRINSSVVASAQLPNQYDEPLEEAINRIDAAATKAVDVAEALQNKLESGDFDGFSPTVSILENTSDSYTLKVTTKDNVILTPNLKGGVGPQGEKGKDGVSVTHSWNGTTLVITSASGTSYKDLKGDQGEKGQTGPAGPMGPQGPLGNSGIAISEDTPPTDGSINVWIRPDGITVDDIKGPQGERGPIGPTGPSGSDGQDGLSPTIEVQDISDGHRVTVTDINGSQSFDVLNGTDSNILKAQTVLTSAVNVLTLDTDTNGDPFALKHAEINIYVPETATPSGSTAITLRCSVNGVESENSYSSNGTANSTLGLGQFRNGGNHAQINLSSVGSDGKYILIGIAPVMSFYDDGTPNITAERYTVTTLEAGSTWEYIRSVKLFPSQSSSVLPIGTVVEIWGY